MNNQGKMASQTLLVIYRCLLALVLIILLVIAGGVIWAVFLKVPPGNTKPAQISSQSASQTETGNVFTGIGRLRLPLGGSMPATAIVSITFPYNPLDKAFSEELASRVGEFRALTGAYFKSRTASQLEKIDEEDIKKALLNQYNEALRLGKIEILYFNDYMIFD